MITISREIARRFILGKQGLWPGRRWQGDAQDNRRGPRRGVSRLAGWGAEGEVVIASGLGDGLP